MKKQIVAVVLTAVWLIEAFDGPVITRAELQPVVRKSERTEATTKHENATETAFQDYVEYLTANFAEYAERAINGRRSDEDTVGETVDIGAIETGTVDSDSEEYIPEPVEYCEEPVYVEPEPEVAPEPEPEPAMTYVGDWTITFYCQCEQCCGKWAWSNSTASGAVPQAGWTVAAGSSYPFGTILYIEGFGTYEVQDRGVPDGWVDIYVNDHSEIPGYGMTVASVYIVG